MKANIALASTANRVDTVMLSLREESTIEEAVACIDRSGRVSIALVVDQHDRLINTLSDGDVRRGIMAGLRLTDSIASLLQIKARTSHPLPVTALAGTDDATLLDIMQLRAVRQIPLITPHGRAIDIVTLGDLIPDVPHALQAVVMAGGEGRRLRPLTEAMPKPMLPVGGRPLMELIIDQLRDVGVRKLNIATHYQADKIIDHFRDGSAFGVNIEYTREDAPLGTGGALGVMTPPTDPVLVINGDILTDIDFRAMHAFHEESHAQMTVAVRRYEVQVPYGVVECSGVKVTGLREKPDLNFFVNAGIYLLEPSVYAYIPPNEHLNMTDLIELLIARGESVVSFPVREYWLDIGQHADYERAQRDAKNGKWR
jgi:dTDP-glucose pyrophosphorylase/CBS domain-containing protein